MFLQNVVNTIKKFRLISKGDKILIAVSGGADSIALLFALYQLKDIFDLDLCVAHLDHCFRGKESEEDAAFVRNFSDKLGIPSTIGKIDVPKIIAKEKPLRISPPKI